jgi:hypothetical protein
LIPFRLFLSSRPNKPGCVESQESSFRHEF